MKYYFNRSKVIQPIQVLFFGLMLLTSPRLVLSQETPNMVNSTETVISDMSLPHAGRPHGVPDSYTWVSVPRINMGNDPGGSLALTAWGQLYEDISGNSALNARVQIQDMVTYTLGKTDGQWHQVQSSHRVEGAAYREDFIGDINKPADIRNESDGSISVTAGGGFNFHFWPSERATINPNDISGVFTTVQARLILDDLSKPDDRAIARYLLNVGVDYWNTPDARWDNWTTNDDAGMGRFKYVNSDWQAFNMSTVPTQIIRLNPPPGVSTGSTSDSDNIQSVPEPSSLLGLIGMGIVVALRKRKGKRLGSVAKMIR